MENNQDKLTSSITKSNKVASNSIVPSGEGLIDPNTVAAEFND